MLGEEGGGAILSGLRTVRFIFTARLVDSMNSGRVNIDE